MLQSSYHEPCQKQQQSVKKISFYEECMKQHIMKKHENVTEWK